MPPHPAPVLAGFALPSTVAASNAAFFTVFAVFVAAILVLAVLTLRWAIRRDRVGLADWRRRRTAAAFGDDGTHGADQAVRGNGHDPRRPPRPPRRRAPQGPDDPADDGEGDGLTNEPR